MTTFQDPPLQSRRTVRQNERDQSPAAVVPTTGPTPTPVAPAAPGEPLTYSTQARPATPAYEGPSFRARRTPDPVGDVPAAEAAAQAAADQSGGTFRPRDYSPEGRRSASPSWAPQYGGAGADAAPAAVAAAAATPVAVDSNSTYAPQTHPAPDVMPSALDSEDAIEHTLTRRELRALRDAHGITATSTGETVYETPQPAQPPVEAAVQAPAPVTPSPPAPDVAPSAGTPFVAPSTRLDSALAEFDQLAAGRPAAVPSDPPAPRGRRAAAAKAAEAEAPVVEPPAADAVTASSAAGPAQVSADVLGPQPIPLVAPPVAQPAAAPVAAPAAAVPAAPAAVPAAAVPAAPEATTTDPGTATDGVAVFDALFAAPTPVEPSPPIAPQPEVVVAELIAQPVTPAPVAEAPYEQIIEATVVEPESAAAALVTSEPSTSTPPTGHWSTQAKLDDETQFGDVKLARNIGSTAGAITTSALVLPSIPTHEFGPLASGDVMVTGSISLPASLSATGAHPTQLDESDLDHLLDPGDHQVANTDSQPVRAIKAVSTHTSSRGVIQTVKPKGTRGLTALIIAATSMAVLVGALFIVLVVTGQLG